MARKPKTTDAPVPDATAAHRGPPAGHRKVASRAGAGDLPVMGDDLTDPTTAADWRRMRAARKEARERVREVYRDRASPIRDAFLQEIGATVRSASPFLISLVAFQGETVDELVSRIGPVDRWPRAPSLSQPVHFRPARDRGDYLMYTASGWTKAVRLRGLSHRIPFMKSGDDWAHLEIVNHSLEVEARIGPVKFETLFGTLRIELDHRLPETLAAACVGKTIGDVIDHAALRGCDWSVTGLEDPPPRILGQTLIVATGSTDYRMPWMR